MIKNISNLGDADQSGTPEAELATGAPGRSGDRSRRSVAVAGPRQARGAVPSSH